MEGSGSVFMPNANVTLLLLHSTSFENSSGKSLIVFKKSEVSECECDYKTGKKLITLRNVVNK